MLRGIDLVLLADGSAVMVHKGDSEGGVEAVNLPADAAARANAIASWLADDCHSGFAALDLEPLDSSDTLSVEAKAEWREAISESNSHTQVSVGAIEPLVRGALGNDTIYTRVRDALADPASDEGQLLLTAIRATGDGGNYMYLESGEWEDLAL